MARNIAFTQDAVKRAVKGASSAGMQIGKMECDPISGKIIIFARGEADLASGLPLDDWLKNNAHKS